MTTDAAIVLQSLSPLQRRLFAALRPNQTPPPDDLRSCTDDEWTALLDLAAGMRIQPLFLHRMLTPLFQPAVPEEVSARLAERRRQIAARALRAHADLHRIVRALQARQIKVVALKGLQLATVVYGNVAARPMRDLDLLVPPGDLAAAGEVMATLGYTASTPFTVRGPLEPYHQHHLPQFEKAGATPVEIHWHIVDREAGVRLDVNELWERSVPARVAGASVLVLSPADLLLHLCIHATCHHRCQVSARSWCDIAETIRWSQGSLDWNDVVERAGRWHCRRGTFLALTLTRHLLDADIPAGVLDSLRPAAFDESILACALRQPTGRPMPDAVAAFGAVASPGGRVRAVSRRVFLSRQDLAHEYAASGSAPHQATLHLRRLRDLWTRHAGSLWRLQRGDAAMVAHARDAVTLREFLSVE